MGTLAALSTRDGSQWVEALNFIYTMSQIDVLHRHMETVETLEDQQGSSLFLFFPNPNRFPDQSVSLDKFWLKSGEANSNTAGS